MGGWARTRRGERDEEAPPLAMVARPEMIDPERFGVTFAANRGLVGGVFVSEAEAVAWLDGTR